MKTGRYANRAKVLKAMANLLSRYDVDDYAASVKIYAVKASG